MEIAKRINRHRISVMVNYLGEEFRRPEDVDESVRTYARVMKGMRAAGIGGAVSIKPTQIGLRVSTKRMEHNYADIVERANSNGIFVWLDMETPDTVDRTISMYLRALRNSSNIGICIQSYLKRSHGDLHRIVGAGGTVRLVKGAYGLVEGDTLMSRQAITKNYLELMEYLFAHSGRFMIATHDRAMIRRAMHLGGLHKRDVTYAMLNGIDNRYALRLAREGNSVSLYLPFGTRWVEYAYRRFMEAGHARLILHSLARNQRL